MSRSRWLKALLILMLGLNACVNQSAPTGWQRPDALPDPASETIPAPPVADDGWQHTSPGGGGAFNAIGGGPSGILLAASDLSGAYRSLDGGQHWDVIGAFRGLTVTHVSAVGFDPQDAAIMYLGTEDGLFRSQDFGATFAPVLSSGYITAVTFAPSDPNIGYLAYHSRYDLADGQVYQTTDRGLHWQQVSDETLPANLHILKILVSRQNPQRLYLLTGEGRFACGLAALYESRDGGRSWVRLAADLGQVADVALAPDAEALYLTTYGDIWDAGYRCIRDDPAGGFLYRGQRVAGGWQWAQWTDERRLGSRNLWVWPDAGDDQRVRVIDMDYPELWETTDGGQTWAWIGSKETWATGWATADFAYGSSFNGDAKTLGYDLSDPAALLWVDSQFLWATRDLGRTFFPLHTREVAPGRWQSRGADNVVPFDLAISADGQAVYLALPDVGCFLSLDGGYSWQNCNQADYVGGWEGNGGVSMTVLADPLLPERVWITQAEDLAARHTLLCSDARGQSWQPVGDGLPLGIPAGLSLLPSSPPDNRTLFITIDGDVYRSRDGGEHWSLVLACGGCRYTAADAQGRVYAAGEAGFWRSLAEGNPGTWEQTGLPSMQGNLGGDFWNVYWEGVASIRPDPVREGWVYVAVFGAARGLYLSRDSGQTWEHLLQDDFLRDVAIFAERPNWLFVASSSALYSGGYDAASAGVRFSPDGGKHWYAYNEGLPWPFAFRLLFDPQTPTRLWLASPGTGYYYRDITPLLNGYP